MRTALIRLLTGAGLLLGLLGAQPFALAQTETLRMVMLVDDPQGSQFSIESAENIPAAWLSQAGLVLQEGDQLLLNGQPVEPGRPIERVGAVVLQIRRAAVFTVLDGEEPLPLRTSEQNIAGSLWEAGRPLRVGDLAEQPAGAVPSSGSALAITRARTVTIETAEGRQRILTAAETVGEVLADAGLALQGLDYSLPAADKPLGNASSIRVVRVREEILLEQTALPYQREVRQDPEVPLDTQEITQPGEFGLQVTRLRVRYEDGREVSRQEEQGWVAKQPQDEVVGYGSKVVPQTIETPYGELEYYRAVTVYATSYSPCRSGVDACYSGTASGLPVRQGVIGVTRAWYNQMLGQRLYVPGYGIGTIADVGGGVPGEYWIDLGYSDEDYVPWHSYVTVYFLTPVPASVPWILP